MNIALLYEHPEWSDSLIKTFQANGVDLQLINIADLCFATAKERPDFDLAINRINIMPSSGRSSSVVSHTLHYLSWLETMGVTVINGSYAHFAGASKALQNGLFSRLGLHCPQAIAVHRVQDVLEAAKAIGFPVIIKPNIGGSGSGIVRYDSSWELQSGVDSGEFDLGIDGTGLVQEYIQSDGYVYRVEILGDGLFYSIKQKMIADTFNYCAADGCSVSQPAADKDSTFDHCALNEDPRIQPFTADERVVSQVISILRGARADLGGVEYLLDSSTNTPCYYDFNPYSNFVPNGPALLGFSPEQRFVDYIKDRSSKQSAG